MPARLRLINAAVAAAILAVGGAGLLFASPARAAERTLVAVWATAGGETSLPGAQVRIFEGNRLIRRDNGARSEQTSPGGTSLLAFGRLPGRFLVEVVSRGRLGGTFKAVVRRYQSGTVVFVNPITTLIADIMTAHSRGGREVSFGQARREVYRALGIPSWETPYDLLYSRAVVDRASYKRATSLAGGANALNPALVRAAIGHRGGRFFRSGDASGWPQAGAAVDKSSVVASIFKDLASGIIQAAGFKAATPVLGWVMAAFGLQDNSNSQDLMDVRQTLDELGRQITEVKSSVELAGFSNLVAQTANIIGDIKYAMTELQFLVNEPAGTPQNRVFTEKLLDFIGKHLLSAPQRLDQHLGSDVPLADNLVKSASRLLGSRRFFDSRSSDEVRSVYDYFAAYQAQLAILLIEYYHANPDVYTQSVAKANLQKIEAYVTNQASSLKPRVPDGAVLDTRDGLMWTQAILSQPGNPVFQNGLIKLGDLIELIPKEKREYGRSELYFEWRLKPFATSTGLPGLPFANWALPTFDDMNRLLSHRGADSPYDWLANQAHISPTLLNALQSHFWLRETLYTQLTGSSPLTTPEVCFELYTLQEARAAARSCKLIETGAERTAALGTRAGTLYQRQPAAAEQYWWH